MNSTLVKKQIAALDSMILAGLTGDFEIGADTWHCIYSNARKEFRAHRRISKAPEFERYKPFNSTQGRRVYRMGGFVHQFATKPVRKLTRPQKRLLSRLEMRGSWLYKQNNPDA